MRGLFLLWGLLIAGAAHAEAPWLRWPPVDGAGGYLVELSHDSSVTSTTVTQPEFAVEAPPGDYEIRVTTLDRFLKPAGRTGWMRFTVARAVTPAVTAISPREAAPGMIRFTLEGSGFSAATKVILEGEEGTAAVTDAKAISERQMEFEAALAPGVYTLVVTNPPAQQIRVPGSVAVAPLPEPQIEQKPEPLPPPQPEPDTAPVTEPATASVAVRVGSSYSVLLPLGTWSQVLGPSYWNADAFVLWPLWGDSGPLVRLGYSHFDSRPNDDLASSRLNMENLAAGASWSVPTLPLRLWLAPGLAFTQASASGGAASSLDVSLEAGVGFTVCLSPQTFGEVGTEYRILIYQGTPLQTIGLSARGGIRF